MIFLILNFIFIDSGSDFNYILSNESLNIKFFLINLRQCHDAYSNKKLEQTRSVSRNNNENMLQTNLILIRQAV